MTTDTPYVVPPTQADWSHRGTFRNPVLWDRYLNLEHPFSPGGWKEQPIPEVKDPDVTTKTSSS